MLKFMSLSSGSCGNCYFLGRWENDRLSGGLLIDAGVSLRRLKQELGRVGLDYSSFSAILVTHDHLDHIRNLGSYCKKLCKPVYATSVLHNALAHHNFTMDHIASCRKILSEGEWNEIAGFKVRYFVVPHDATQTVGYAIEADGQRFVIMTDIGEMTSEALGFASEADTVVIESNFDVDMLLAGPYTYDLKMRICKGHGHLSNDGCAKAIQAFWHEGLHNIFLCHLSENNNTPQLAHESAKRALAAIGIDHASINLRPLPRNYASALFTL